MGLLHCLLLLNLEKIEMKLVWGVMHDWSTSETVAKLNITRSDFQYHMTNVYHKLLVEGVGREKKRKLKTEFQEDFERVMHYFFKTCGHKSLSEWSRRVLRASEFEEMINDLFDQLGKPHLTMWEISEMMSHWNNPNWIKKSYKEIPNVLEFINKE